MTILRSLAALGAGILLAMSVRPALAQEPPPAAAQPTFRSAVDLVAVDVAVIGDGRPVTGLGPQDFALAVDGAPRRVISAEYVSATTAQKPAGASPVAATYSTNVAASSGRLIMFVVDQGSIGPGRGRAVMESASRFIDQLTPADRVGLISFPGAGAQIDFTTNHAVVQAGLVKLLGQADTFPTNYRIGISEALALQRGDRTVLSTMTDRECTGFRVAEEIEFCRTQILRDASGLYSLVRERTLNSMSGLRDIIKHVGRTDAPKTIVYVSEGLVLDQMGEAAWISHEAARARVTIQVLQLEAPAADASAAREPATPGRDRALAREGLEWVAGSTRGAVFPIASGAEAAFKRLATELAGYYLLGFEPQAADRDGKPHKIKVSVPGRSGVEIRARSEFTMDAAVADRKTDDVILADTLKAPGTVNEIGLKLSA
jgi:VWFA-related protein